MHLNLNILDSTGHDLPRTIGYFSGTMMCLGMMLGSGIFSVPATILGNVGSVGMTVVIFTIGAIVSFCGTLSFCELGCMRPFSGGEKEYLDYSYPKTKGLYAFAFTQIMIFLLRPGTVAADAIAFGEYMIYATIGTKEELISSGHESVANNLEWYARGLGVICIVFTTMVHGFHPKLGILIQDGLTVIKVLVLVLIIVTGIVAATGLTSLPRAGSNFEDFMSGSSSQATSYTTALFSVFFSYDGWNNLNYSLDELIDPVVNLPRSALTAIALASFLYISATLSYFVVVPKEAINTSATVLAGQFFAMTMGETAGHKVLPIFVAFSAFGSVMCMSFGVARVAFCAAKEGYLPYPKIWGPPTDKTGPIGALVLNMVVSMILMLAPPPGPIYNFLINLSGYPEWIFYGITIVGLMYLRYTEPDTIRPFKSYWVSNILFLIVCIFLTVLPFVPPTNTPQASAIPFWLYPTIGWICMLGTVPWWYVAVYSVKYHDENATSKTDKESDLYQLQTVGYSDKAAI